MVLEDYDSLACQGDQKLSIFKKMLIMVNFNHWECTIFGIPFKLVTTDINMYETVMYDKAIERHAHYLSK